MHDGYLIDHRIPALDDSWLARHLWGLTSGSSFSSKGSDMTAKRQPWTEEDVRRLRLLADAGIGAVNIAKSLGRSRASVTQKAHWLNLPLAQKAKSLPSTRLE